MRASVVACGVLAILLLIACARQASPTPTPVPVQVFPSPEVPLSPEVALHQRAEAAIAALGAGEWKAYYEYQSPRLRRRRWPYGLDIVQPCLLAKFAVETDEALARFRGSLGIGEDASLTLAVNRIKMETTTAQVYVDVFHNDELVDVAEDGDAGRWALIDGEWWREDRDLGGCPTLGFGGVQDTEES